MIAQTACKFRAQLDGFSGKLAYRLSKPLRKFVFHMLYGLMARQSVLLSEISRALDEPKPLHKVVTRLSHHLGCPFLQRRLEAALLHEAAAQIGPDTLIVLDPSDIVKPYAQKMEGLCRVRDGSRSDAKETVMGDGFWLLQALSVEKGGDNLRPLMLRAWSSEGDPEFSENKELIDAAETIMAATQKRGILTIDRGGDRKTLITPFMSRNYPFLIRQRGDRHVLFNRKYQSILQIAASCPITERQDIVRINKDGQEEIVTLEYGCRQVGWPGLEDKELWLVVLKGWNDKPLMLLTNRPMTRSKRDLRFIVDAYLTRWRVEDTIRFIKQSYQLEDVRVMTMRRLKNLLALVNMAAYFTIAVLGTHIKLKILRKHIARAAKTLFESPKLFFYELSRGISEVCRQSPIRQVQTPRRPEVEQADFLFG